MQELARLALAGEDVGERNALALCKWFCALGYYPDFAGTHCLHAGTTLASNGDVFAGWYNQYEITPEGVNDGIRSAMATVCTERAGYMRWDKGTLALILSRA
jgi:hypothetical protein